MATALIPIPELDSDPTEVAVSWQVITRLGHHVVFATPSGKAAQCDRLMITGEGLDPWGFIPGLRRVVAIGQVLRANRPAREAYAAMQRSPEFRSPVPWREIDLDRCDGVLLPGGHRARGMRAYLESDVLQGVVVEAFRRGMPVAAVCHGVLLAARSVDSRTGRSVLHGRRTTGLPWSMERTAWRIARVTRFWDRDYYRTYTEQPGQPAGYRSVQQEVERALARPQDFSDVDPSDRLRSSGRHRDSFDDERPAYVVQDGSYLSARWPGDVNTFAKRFAEMLSRVDGKTAGGAPSLSVAPGG